MGGEWIFTIKQSGLSSLDLQKYRRLLREVKAEAETNPEKFETVEWAATESEAKESNVFTRC
jgi:hypothetical protein